MNHDTMDPRGAMRAGAGYEDGEYAWEDNKGNKVKRGGWGEERREEEGGEERRERREVMN